MKVVVIGGTGHIGRFLVRRLIENGDEAVILSSGQTPGDALGAKLVALPYYEMFSDGSFDELLASEKPDAVVDILQGNTPAVYAACETAGVDQLVCCGSIWMFGRARVVPTPETPQSLCPYDVYQTRFEQLADTIRLSLLGNISVSAIMPPNICGPGKVPLEGHGGRSLDVHKAHRDGKEVILPFPGTNLLGPCDADDVAQGFFCALKNPEVAAGQIFNVGSAYALTIEEFIKTYADIYDTNIPIRFVEPTEFIRDVLPDDGANFHFTAHMCPDVSKIRSLLGYVPRFTPEQTMERAVRWMYDSGLM